MMDANFWHQRWQENNIPFHEGRVNGYLKIYFDRLGLKPGESVFVPLCGKALDMVWIGQKGQRVLGVELSAIAVRHFFSENGIEFDVDRIPGFERYSGAEVEILCGDFFDLTDAHFQNVRGVYDRASFIAFDAGGRQQYARFMCDRLRAGTPVLLLTLEYPQSIMSGPPFSVGDAEVRRQFESRFRVDLLETRDIIDKQPHFQAKGLPTLLAHAFLLTDV